MSNQIGHNTIKFSFLKISIFSWALIFSYIFAIISMNIPFIGYLVEEIIVTLPLLIFLIYLIQKKFYLTLIKDKRLNKKEIFYRDFFYISYSFILAGFLSLVFQYNNSDAKAWWPFFIYINFFYSIVFSWIFAGIANLLNPPQNYTIKFSALILFSLALSKYWTCYLDTLYIEGFFIGLIILIFSHLFICIILKLNSKKSFLS